MAHRVLKLTESLLKLNGATVRKVWRIRGYSGDILTGLGLVQLKSNVPTEPGIYLFEGLCKVRFVCSKPTFKTGEEQGDTL